MYKGAFTTIPVLNLLDMFIVLILENLIKVEFKGLIYSCKFVIFYNIVILILGEDSNCVSKVFNFKLKLLIFYLVNSKAFLSIWVYNRISIILTLNK